MRRLLVPTVTMLVLGLTVASVDYWGLDDSAVPAALKGIAFGVLVPGSQFYFVWRRTRL